MLSITDLAWLSGSWLGRDGDRNTEEHWTSPVGGTMLGSGRTVDGDRTVHREQMFIEQREDGIVYVVSIGDGPRVEFRLVRQGPADAVFENPDHTFPQRITYSRDREELRAWIENPAEGRRMEWAWTRAPSGWAPPR